MRVMARSVAGVCPEGKTPQLAWGPRPRDSLTASHTEVTVRILVLPALLLVGAIAPVAAQNAPPDAARQQAQHAPLFQSHDILELRLEAPLRSVFRERGEESTDHPSVLQYLGPDGDTVRLDVGVRTRGFFRLQPRVCRFPPLRLNVRTSDMVGTLFEGQDKLKLVTHCQTGRDEYQRYLLHEYLAYRIYNVLTDVSFRVRLARVTYVDTGRDDDPITSWGFLIEDEEMLATRLGWQVLEVPSILPSDMDQRQLSIFELFQFLIANTDWSLYQTEEAREGRFHNTWYVGFPWGPVMPVPYDFDFSGLVNARYAQPASVTGLRSVRERRFWGVCRPPEHIAAVIPLFEERREAIADLVRTLPGLEQRDVEDTIEYIDEFYDIVLDTSRAEREILERCRRFRVGS